MHLILSEITGSGRAAPRPLTIEQQMLLLLRATMNGVKHHIVYRVTGELMLAMSTSDQQSPFDSLQREFAHRVRVFPKVVLD